ncbi:MAG: S8 family peptidase, partial [Firmicutes bacterium]|nr:S8 family peptidase [Bacillota bacterium]
PHPDLTEPTNRIIAFQDIINNRTSPYDDNGHGTHVSGDIASNGLRSQGTYRGPAPDASLIGVKVLDKYGMGSTSEVIAGLTWAVENRDKYKIRILSMSLGSTASTSYRDDPLAMAVENVWQENIVVCVAAGNSGPGERTVNSPGIAPSVITVGALDDRITLPPAGNIIADFSSRGPTVDELTKPDVVAPGVNVVSLRSPGSMLDKKNKNSRINSWYISMSGTSMATPVCSGVCALLLEANPGLMPDNVKNIIMETASSLNLDPNTQGAGLVDAKRALEIALQEKQINVFKK